MEYDEYEQTKIVRLSKRNLQALLTKLDHEWSAKTITRSFEDGITLVVIAEDDDTHYGKRQPGTMHPDTEKDIASAREEDHSA